MRRTRPRTTGSATSRCATTRRVAATTRPVHSGFASERPRSSGGVRRFRVKNRAGAADGQPVTMRRRFLIGFLAVLPLLVLAGWTAVEYWPHDPPPPLPAPRDPALPDLTVAPLTDLVGGETEEGAEQQILFSASIANRGPGPFMINAVRGDEHGQWRVSQRFVDTGGAKTEVETPADMTWAGHGHLHWHVRIGAAYALYTVPGNRRVRSLEKVGYCFFDQKPYDRKLEGAPKAAVFPKDSCDGESTL